MKWIIICLLMLFSTVSVADGELYINLSKQRFAYKVDGQTIRSGEISSGKKSHRTPRGTFSILYKQRYKKSRMYPKPRGGAPMPYSIQIYGNIFIHQGVLPGYPASHGCIRMRRKDARFIFDRMDEGDVVIVR